MNGVKIGGFNINNLRYADETVLLAESEEELQAILDRVNDAGHEFGMNMSAKKTEVMLISKDEIKPKLKIVIDGIGRTT